MVVISLNNMQLQRFLRKRKSDFCVVNASENDRCLPEFLRSLKKHDIFDTSLEFRNAYLKSYLDLIDRLTISNQSRSWWAYYASSKNRHSSKIFDDLYTFTSIISFLKRLDEEEIILLNPPLSIAPSLIRYLRRKRKKIKVIGNRFLKGYHGRLYTALIFIFDTSARMFILFMRMLFSKIVLARKFKETVKDHGSRYIFRSWFTVKSFPKNGIYRDAFFTQLCGMAQKQGKSVLIVVGMFGVKFRNALRPMAGIRNFAVFPLEFFLRPPDLVQAFLNTLFSRIGLRSRVSYGYEKMDISGIIRYHLNSDFARSVFQNTLNFYFAKNMVRRLKTERFFLTSENNPWEKMSIQAIRKYSRQTRIAGFQHTIVSLAKLNMVLSADSRGLTPLPDYIVTSGKVTRDILLEVGGYPKEMVRTGCALRFERTFEFAPKNMPQGRQLVFLVPLEGVNESAGLVNFLLEALGGAVRYKVIIRPHPVLPLEKMRQYLSCPPNYFPQQFSVSIKKDVTEDLLAADILLYDSSTVCLEALAMGIPAVYIDLKRPVNYDPLFGCAYLKRSASSAQDIDAAADFFTNLPPEEFRRQQEAAREYVRSYFYPVNEANLQAFVS